MTSADALVDAWLRADPDPATRRAIESERHRPAWVRDHFAGALRFGTAGMRAPVGPGPARMNRVMARLAARAVAAEMTADTTADTTADMTADGLSQRGAVVGFDARTGSADMAFDAARLIAAAGIPTAVIDGPAPTPLLAHQLVARGAAAGLMITASHNPRGDNGLKLYWADGTQIRPPLDRRIERRLDLAVETADLPDESDLAARHELELLDMRAVIAAYVAAAVRPPVFVPASAPSGEPEPEPEHRSVPESALPSRTAGDDPQRLGDPAAQTPRFVYTALCGVGARTLGHAAAAAGLAPAVCVEHQCRPDGSFEGLPFPNPEEPGTLDDATALAERQGIDLVLANDPDADRLAVAVREPDGGWHQLSGDELGLLLCDWLIELAQREQAGRSPAPLISASSVVSATMVPALCTARGVEHWRTLTGFKWIMTARLARPEARWVFGYEEALGYSVTDALLDKDGIGAAVEFVRLAGALAARGIGPLERLDELAAEIGLHVTTTIAVRADPETISAAMTKLRSHPPTVICGCRVVKIVDWMADRADWADWADPMAGWMGAGRAARPDARPSDAQRADAQRADAQRADAQRADLIEMHLTPAHAGEGADGAEVGVRLCIRPSGTEPKAKIYLEAVSLEAVSEALGDLAAERRRLRALLDSLADELRSSLFAFA